MLTIGERGCKHTAKQKIRRKKEHYHPIKGTTQRSKMMNLIWDEVFTTEDLSKKSEKEVCAIGLKAWQNCIAGLDIPESFGRVMHKISKRLGVPPTGESLLQWVMEN